MEQISIRIEKNNGITTIYKNEFRVLSTVFSNKEAFDNTFCILFGLKK